MTGEVKLKLKFFITIVCHSVEYPDTGGRTMSNDLAPGNAWLRQVACTVCERHLRLSAVVAILPAEDHTYRDLASRYTSGCTAFVLASIGIRIQWSF